MATIILNANINDTFSAISSPGADSIYGLSGSDTISAGAGDDWVYGDRLPPIAQRGDATIDDIVGARVSFNDVLDGGSGRDRLFGDQGNDVLRGGADSDWLYGGSGNDRLVGNGGVDYFNGGSGIDRIDYSYSGGGWRIDLAADIAQSLNGPTTERVISIENVFGSQGNDIILGDDGRNDLEGERGNDRIEGRGGDDTLEGEAGRDTLFGGDGNDLLLGGRDNDRLFGFDDNDRLDGGSGADRLEGGEGNDRLIGGSGNDSLFGGSGNDYLTGNAGVDSFNGGIGVDRIDYSYSGGGWRIDLEADVARSLSGPTIERVVSIENVFGSQGNDVILGDDGRNDLEGERGNDRIHGRGGNDVLEGEAGRDTLDGDRGNDRLFGGDDNDVLFGGRGHDALFGGDGNDQLAGSFGDDTLDGGAGDDLATGGSGSDTFIFSTDDTPPFTQSSLTIIDFASGIDTLVMDDVTGNTIAMLTPAGVVFENPEVDDISDLDTNGNGVIEADDQNWSVTNGDLVFNGLRGDLTLEGVTQISTADVDVIA